jgi:putative membrane protein
MKKPFGQILCAIILGSLFLGCNNGQTDSTTAAKDTNAAKIDSANSPAPPVTTMPATVSKDDAKFVVDAVEGGMMEVQLGQLAQQKAGLASVKSFGSMMERDHTASGNRLKGLAEEKSITLAGAMAPGMQKKIDKLKNDDKNFDRDYIDLMVDDHMEDIMEFNIESKKGSDADIRAFADSTSHMLHIHLDSAQSCQNHLKKG